MPLNKPCKTQSLTRCFLIPMFMVDFLNIAPFDNGTERMSRLLLTLLLYRSGYEVEQYSSIDAISS